MKSINKQNIVNLLSKKDLRREAYFMISTIFFLALGFLIIWFSKNYLPLENNIVYSILLLSPIFIYMLFSGRITEFKVPGFLEGKISSISEKELDIPEFKPITFDFSLDLDDVTVMGKNSRQALFDKIQFLDKSKPIFLTLIHEKKYFVNDFETYIETLSTFKTFRFIVLLGKDEKFLAFMDLEFLRSITKNYKIDDFLHDIASKSFSDLLDDYPFDTNKIKIPTTNMKVLQEMATRNLDAIAIVDANDKLRGVIEREDILSKIVFALIKSNDHQITISQIEHQ
jgi:hypothetical protein